MPPNTPEPMASGEGLPPSAYYDTVFSTTDSTNFADFYNDTTYSNSNSTYNNNTYHNTTYNNPYSSSNQPSNPHSVCNPPQQRETYINPAQCGFHDYTPPATISPNILQPSQAHVHIAPNMSHTTSSISTSSQSLSSQASDSARISANPEIGKRRTRSKQPLKPILVDESDPRSVKRARNTLSARGSRFRRDTREKQLVKDNAQLAQEVEMWKQRANQLGWHDEMGI